MSFGGAEPRITCHSRWADLLACTLCACTHGVIWYRVFQWCSKQVRVLLQRSWTDWAGCTVAMVPNEHCCIALQTAWSTGPARASAAQNPGLPVIRGGLTCLLAHYAPA